MRRVMFAALVALLVMVPLALAYPPATLTATESSITLGGLDCGTSYRVRVEERSGSRWTNAQMYTQATRACATPTPSPTPTSTPTATPTATPASPVADFTITPEPAVRTQQTLFASSGSCEAAPCAYVWVHGDASSTEEIGSGPEASFTYTGHAGERTVTLKVTDALGRADARTRTFDLVEPEATPTPTPTATPSPTPTPEPGAYPNALNTGVPAGTILTPSSSLTIDTAGTVIDGRDISGTVVVNAPNVTIRNSRIRPSAADTFIAVDSNSTGLLIEDSEIDGGASFGRYTHQALWAQNVTVRRVEMTGAENGVNIATAGDVLIEDSWIHDLDDRAGAHTDGIQVNQGAHDFTIRHNTIDPVPDTDGATSPIIMWNEGDPQNSRVWIEGNRLLGEGASFTIYTPRQSGGSDIYVRDNRMQRGIFGYRDGCCVTEWSGNVDDTTGQSVTG